MKMPKKIVQDLGKYCFFLYVINMCIAQRVTENTGGGGVFL